AGTLLDDLVLLDALEADVVVDEEIALGALREVPAADDLAAAGRPHHTREDLHAGVLPRVLDAAGQRQAEAVGPAGSVGDEVLAAAVVHLAPGVGEVVGDEDLQLVAARLEAVDAGLRLAHRAERRLGVGAVENALVEVQPAVRPPEEGVHGVVAVARAEAVQD